MGELQPRHCCRLAAALGFRMIEAMILSVQFRMCCPGLSFVTLSEWSPGWSFVEFEHVVVFAANVEHVILFLLWSHRGLQSIFPVIVCFKWQ